MLADERQLSFQRIRGILHRRQQSPEKAGSDLSHRRLSFKKISEGVGELAIGRGFAKWAVIIKCPEWLEGGVDHRQFQQN